MTYGIQKLPCPIVQNTDQVVRSIFVYFGVHAMHGMAKLNLAPPDGWTPEVQPLYRFARVYFVENTEMKQMERAIRKVAANEQK